MNSSYNIKQCSSYDSPSFIITQFPSQKYVFNQMAVCVVNCVLILPALLLNIVCVVTVLRSQVLKGKLCFFLIMLQSIADLAVVTIAIPSFTYLFYGEAVGKVNCTEIFVLSSTALVTGGLSLATLCALTFERYMGILHPITHRSRLSKKMFFVYLGAFTVVLLVGVPIATASAVVYYIGMVTVIGVTLVLNAIAYVRIFIGVRRRFQAESVESTDSDTSQRSAKLRFIQESKLARSCAIVVSIFYLCYLPGLVLCLYFVKTDKILYRIVHSWYTANFALNSTINSVIFFWKRPLLRKEAFKVLKSCVALEN